MLPKTCSISATSVLHTQLQTKYTTVGCNQGLLSNARSKNCCISKDPYIYSWLTDGLCCTCSCSSHSHHILSSHWHTVIAWGRIWGWLKGVTTPPSCAPGNIYIMCTVHIQTLENNPVLSDVPIWVWTYHPWIHWVLKKEISNSHTRDWKRRYELLRVYI